MKWLGAFLLLCTTTWIGFEWSKKLSDRPKHIRQLINALQILEAEIVYSQLPLQEAFEVIGRQLPKPANLLFAQVAVALQSNTANLTEIWSASVNQWVKLANLDKNEQEILLQFGATLGQHDAVQQTKHIQLALHHLEREMQEARDQHIKYAKLAKSLGVLGGLFIIVLLF
ncbi:stage III sporulation protein SpoIIIAB [Virgibacillus sp. 179-BFC.A HS]|uniref:Stage III sporulation protein SpoIIIAB n=1 Tax=Tigheibacillus jepli TaxID=3035914 RepID=A0ABU5CHB5_9BACI|nr:stage III sporulation protein SpoIIIAB [Virgibacillus sp. 179-BFC.A HS]MDY0405605.1 stage III sporulation protein SpoIIIAB [Virgibacillus sp. 179-BFC.A HS]